MRQLEEPAPRDVDIVVGPVAVVVGWPAAHLRQLAQLIRVLLRPVTRGDAGNPPKHGGRGKSRKEGLN